MQTLVLIQYWRGQTLSFRATLLKFSYSAFPSTPSCKHMLTVCTGCLFSIIFMQLLCRSARAPSCRGPKQTVAQNNPYAKVINLELYILVPAPAPVFTGQAPLYPEPVSMLSPFFFLPPMLFPDVPEGTSLIPLWILVASVTCFVVFTISNYLAYTWILYCLATQWKWRNCMYYSHPWLPLLENTWNITEVQ